MDRQNTPQANLEDCLKDLEHKVWEIRRNACEALAALADARSVGPLLKALEDSVGAVRFAAAEALGKIGDATAVDPLLKRLADPNFGVYGPLIESLANLKSVEAIPHFIRFLRDDDPRVRGLAANALMVMTRQFISFRAKGTKEERNASIAEWETWWAKNKDTFSIS